jgi:hypothetical protein
MLSVRLILSNISCSLWSKGGDGLMEPGLHFSMFIVNIEKKYRSLVIHLLGSSF